MTHESLVNILRALRVGNDPDWSDETIEMLSNLRFINKMWGGMSWGYNISHQGVLYLKYLGYEPDGSIT